MKFSSFLRNLFDSFFPVGIRGGNRKGFVPNLTIKEQREAKGFACVATQYHCVKLAVNWKLLQSRGSQVSHPVCLWLMSYLISTFVV